MFKEMKRARALKKKWGTRTARIVISIILNNVLPNVKEGSITENQRKVVEEFLTDVKGVFDEVDKERR